MLNNRSKATIAFILAGGKSGCEVGIDILIENNSRVKVGMKLLNKKLNWKGGKTQGFEEQGMNINSLNIRPCFIFLCPFFPKKCLGLN